MKTALIILVFAFSCFAQQSLDPKAVCKERGQGIVSHLRKDNWLRRQVESGDVGDCVRKSWMDKMNSLYIKMATYSIEYAWKKNKLSFKVKSISYWQNYFDGMEEVKDSNIHKSSLDRDLSEFILENVKSVWKMERRKNSVSQDTFDAYVFDDEALPTFYAIF